MDRMGKSAVFIIRGDEFEGIEGETAQRVMKRSLLEGDKSLDIFGPHEDVPLTTGDLRKYKGWDVFIIIKGILFATPEGVNTLSRIARKRKELSLIAPMSNESKISYQRMAPPFSYQTLSIYRWAAEEIHNKCKDDVICVDGIDDFCFAFRRDVIDGLLEDRPLIDLPGMMESSGRKCGVAKGVYAHRYGDCYESGREDLLGHVPLKAREVLDIGSARGLFGQLLKKRQKCVVTGIDADGRLVAVARDRLDEVITGDVEEILDRGILGKYDCVVCGDVLEHLNNPWKVVKGLKNHLRKGGIVVASTPNIMNWAIFFDLMRGRWDYVPFSILSGSHIRFFTRDTFTELFEEAGYKVRQVLSQSVGVPPAGDLFIKKLKKIYRDVREDELRASEILLIAEA
jgi:2-polyprenyl-3-methyl-5-hydroxy-6-metoxy-1,4-benzoquinol methylase